MRRGDKDELATGATATNRKRGNSPGRPWGGDGEEPSKAWKPEVGGGMPQSAVRV